MDSECVLYREKIAALAMGNTSELSGAERHELEAHIDVCPQCRLEKESFAQTINMLASVEDEPVPRHFFISPDQEQHQISLWRLFTQLQLLPRAALAGAFVLAILLCGAALAQFHARFDKEGWSVGFGRGEAETAALRDEFLKAAAEESQNNRMQWMEEVRNEIARLREDEELKTRHQEEIIARLDTMIEGRMERSEEQIRYDTQILVAFLYQELARQRATDMEAIKLRLDTAEIREFINARKTEEALITLLQFADLKFN